MDNTSHDSPAQSESAATTTPSSETSLYAESERLDYLQERLSSYEGQAQSDFSAVSHVDDAPAHEAYFGGHVVTRAEMDALQSNQDARLAHLQASLSNDAPASVEAQQPAPISGKFKEASVWPWEHREMDKLYSELAEMRAEESMQRGQSQGKGHGY
jgi:hypothetical protein